MQEFPSGLLQWGFLMTYATKTSRWAVSQQSSWQAATGLNWNWKQPSGQKCSTPCDTGELWDSAPLYWRFCSTIIKFHQFMNRNIVDTNWRLHFKSSHAWLSRVLFLWLWWIPATTQAVVSTLRSSDSCVLMASGQFGPGFLSPSQSWPLWVGGVRFLTWPITGDTCSSPSAGWCTLMRTSATLFVFWKVCSCEVATKVFFLHWSSISNRVLCTNGSQSSLSIKSFQMKRVCFFSNKGTIITRNSRGSYF